MYQWKGEERKWNEKIKNKEAKTITEIKKNDKSWVRRESIGVLIRPDSLGNKGICSY